MRTQQRVALKSTSWLGVLGAKNAKLKCVQHRNRARPQPEAVSPEECAHTHKPCLRVQPQTEAVAGGG